MLNVLELLEMRKEIVNGILFIGIIYSVNYFLKSLIVKDENLDENLDLWGINTKKYIKLFCIFLFLTYGSICWAKSDCLF